MIKQQQQRKEYDISNLMFTECLLTSASEVLVTHITLFKFDNNPMR